MIYLGLDIGDRRIGIAVGNSVNRMATPVEVIERSSSEQDLKRIGQAAAKFEAERLVVGLPKNSDGSIGPQAQVTRAFAEQLEKAMGLGVIFWDEHLTTIEATRKAHETGARGKKARRGLDALAAAVILQDYLDTTWRELD